MDKQPEGMYSRNCWIEGRLREAAIYFSEGTISGIREGRPGKMSGLLDAGERVVMPGVLDAHVHLNEPGRTEWEGFETGTAAAAAGGITTIIDMPLNSHPVTTTAAAFRQKLDASRGKLHVNTGFYGGLIPGNEEELADLIRTGILGIKAFLTDSGIDDFPRVSRKELERAMPLLRDYALPLLVHCEIDDGGSDPQFDLHPDRYLAYLGSRPKSWENEAVRMMIGLCREFRCHTHIVHVSSSDILEEIQKAKEEGLPLTAETCPHYIFFSAEEIPDAQTIYKCAPPIRERSNNERLCGALANGILDFIASDHSPAPPSMKMTGTGDLKKAWGGIAGLQFLLPASWTVLSRYMQLEHFIPLLTERPARFLGLKNKGHIREGCDADLVAWEPDEWFTVTTETSFHKHKLSPYVSQSLRGRVSHTVVQGNLVYEEGRLIKKNAGKWVLKK